MVPLQGPEAEEALHRRDAEYAERFKDGGRGMEEMPHHGATEGTEIFKSGGRETRAGNGKAGEPEGSLGIAQDAMPRQIPKNQPEGEPSG
jgi:hypothetical protein